MLRNKSQVVTHLPPVVCPQDSLAAYAHTHKKKKKDFSPLMTATVGGRKPSASPPSFPPSSPTGQSGSLDVGSQ